MWRSQSQEYPHSGRTARQQHTDSLVGTGTAQQTVSNWQIRLSNNGRGASLKLDTGAHCNVIPKKICNAVTKKASTRASNYCHLFKRTGS